MIPQGNVGKPVERKIPFEFIHDAILNALYMNNNARQSSHAR